MRPGRRLTARSLFGLGLLLAVALGTVRVVAEPLRAERPTYAVGDLWIRSDGVFEVVTVGVEGYVFRSKSGPQTTDLHVSRDLSLRRVVRNGVDAQSFEPPVPFEWPLEVGKGGTSTAVFRRIRPDGRVQPPVSVDVTWGAEAEEEVTVPAGTFRTVRVSVRFTGPHVRGGTTFWYAPEARQIVRARSVDGSGYEVIALRSAKVAAAPPPLAPAVPPAPASPGGDRWAVVIGVDRYESRQVPPLRYSVRDAEALHEFLVGPGGFKGDHVVLLTDRSERKPTLRNIKWALGTFLTRSAKKDDTVLVFFAGHGVPEVDPRGVERDGLSKYLAPADVDPDDLYSTGLPMDELQTIFQRIEAERMVVLLDACYSGTAGGRTFTSLKARTRAAHVDDLFLERLARSKGRAIVTASRPSELSLEVPELGHGLFTYYLLQGLRGAADLNGDAIVSLQELYEYVEQQVTQKSRALGGNQHPMMKSEVEGALPLVKVGGR
jgi:hypothetical protein